MLKKIFNFLLGVITFLFVAIAIMLIGLKLINGGAYTVLSGSMEPTYHVGSLLLVKPIDYQELKEGDAITYALTEQLVVTHRIVEVKDQNQWFITKGDANEVNDASPVYYKNIIGKPMFAIPYLGYLIYYMQRPPGIYIVVVIVIILLVFGLLPIFNKKK